MSPDKLLDIESVGIAVSRLTLLFIRIVMLKIKKDKFLSVDKIQNTKWEIFYLD